MSEDYPYKPYSFVGTFETFTCAYLFKIALEIMWLLIQIVAILPSCILLSLCYHCWCVNVSQALDILWYSWMWCLHLFSLSVETMTCFLCLSCHFWLVQSKLWLSYLQSPFPGLSGLRRLSRSNATSGWSTVWIFFCCCWSCKYTHVLWLLKVHISSHSSGSKEDSNQLHVYERDWD